MWKKHKLVMLLTEKKANNGIVKSINYPNLLGIYRTGDDKYKQWTGQNLYILSHDEIKEGDWCYDKVLNVVYRVDKHTDLKYVNQTDNELKIIATTDELGKTIWKQTNKKSKPYNIQQNIETTKKVFIPLPQIPQSFIQHFVDEYNKGNVISDVMVEYDTISVPYVTGDGFEIVLKINQDNTINIKTVKDSWSRDEVVGILEKFNDRFGSLSLIGDFKSQDRPKFNKWIEEKI